MTAICRIVCVGVISQIIDWYFVKKKTPTDLL